MARCGKVVAGLAALLLLVGAPAAARMLKQAKRVGYLSIPGEGLCTTLCKWNRAALVEIDESYAGLDDRDCMKRCKETAAVVNPGQCRFYACPASKLKYATAGQCQSACSDPCVALAAIVSSADTTVGCTKEVASFNPGQSG